MSEEYREHTNEHYDEIFDQVRNFIAAFGFKESTIPAMSVSPEERERMFQENWDKGTGFDSCSEHSAISHLIKKQTRRACDFIWRKIVQIMKDPEKARN